MHYTPLLLIVACELLVYLIEMATPLPGWLHISFSTALAAALLAFVSRTRKRDIRVMNGLRSEIDGMRQKAAKAARRYKSLLEGAGSAIFIFNAETGLLEEENRLGRELLGISKNELGNMQARDLLPPSEHERFRSFVYQLMRQGRAELDEVQFRRKDGSTFLGEVNARLINLGDEQVAHCVLRDITEKRRSEREIWQRNRELSILNSILTDMSQGRDAEEVQESILSEVMELFHSSGGTVHLYDPDHSTLRLCACREVSSHLSRLIADDIATRPEQYRGIATREDDGDDPLFRGAAAEGWQCIISVPITAKDNMIGVMHLMNAESCNHTAEELRFLESVGKQIGSKIERARLFGELNWKNEELLRSHRLLEKSSHNLSVSEMRLKQNLALVEQANREQSRLDRMKNQFLGMVSHEFNTPLTSIISGVEHLLQQGWSSREDACEVLQMVRDGGLRLKGLVADLLKLIRVEARRGELEASTVHLKSLLAAMIREFRPQLDQRGQQIRLIGMDELPYFDADRSSLQQVFGELLQNAMRFSPESGEIVISGRVVDRRVLEERRENLERFKPDFLRRCGDRCYLEVEVRDAGIGIPPDEQQRIFELFYEVGEIRHHTSGGGRQHGRGAGLGLAIVKGMVEAHGGMVWVESCGGSSFFVILPLEQEAIQPALF